MTSITNHLSCQEVFIAALKEVKPEQKKQMCRLLKEMLPQHPLVAQIAKVGHLLNWNSTQHMLSTSQIKYLEGIDTPEAALTELLWNSHIGGKEIERGNILLFQILSSSDQHELQSKLANSLMEHSEAIGLSPPSLAYLNAKKFQKTRGGYSNPAEALNSYNKVTDAADPLPELIAEAKLGKAIILNYGGQGVQTDLAAAWSLYEQVIKDPHLTPSNIIRAKFEKAQLLHTGGAGIQIDQAAALDIYNQIIQDQHSTPTILALAKCNKALILYTGGPGLQIDRDAALDIYHQVIQDQRSPSAIITLAKFNRAEIFRIQGKLPKALALYSQVIADNSSLELTARSKYYKAQILSDGKGGVRRDRTTALSLFEQVINDQQAPAAFVDRSKFEKLKILIGNSSPSMILEAAHSMKNTAFWEGTLRMLKMKYGGQNLPNLYPDISEEYFYLCELLNTPP